MLVTNGENKGILKRKPSAVLEELFLISRESWQIKINYSYLYKIDYDINGDDVKNNRILILAVSLRSARRERRGSFRFTKI